MSILLAFALALNPYTIHRDRSLGTLRVGTGTLAQARTLYGAPSAIRPRQQTCAVRWPAAGLFVSFLEFSGDPCASGGAVYAVATGRRWHTDRGLRIGDTVARLRALYPRAKAHRDGWWLITRRACAEVGGQRFPGLKARTGRRHVTAFVVSASVCD
jgi:hypothetical protein